MTSLTIKSIIQALVDKDELELAKSFINIKQSKYAPALNNLLSSGDSSELCKLLGIIETPKEVNPSQSNAIPPKMPNNSFVADSNTEVYLLSDFREKSQAAKNKTSELSSEYSKLKPEQKMVLLTIAWAARPSSSSFIIKHCQRISCYFGLDQDSRWRLYYDNNRTKMQSLITNTISKFKKTGLILETKMSTLNKHSVYHLSNQGLSLSRMIADEVGFSLDSAI